MQNFQNYKLHHLMPHQLISLFKGPAGTIFFLNEIFFSYSLIRKSNYVKRRSYDKSFLCKYISNTHMHLCKIHLEAVLFLINPGSCLNIDDKISVRAIFGKFFLIVFTNYRKFETLMQI